MQPSRRTQVLSWCVAIAGVALAYANELFVGLLVVALFLRPDLLAKDLFYRFVSKHHTLLSAALVFMALSALLLLWGLLYGGPQLLSQFGANALWFCLMPLWVLLVIHEAQQFTSK